MFHCHLNCFYEVVGSLLFYLIGFAGMLCCWAGLAVSYSFFFVLQESHGRTKSELHRTEERLTSSLSGVASLEKSLAAASEKYLYMQELRSYFAILCDFLQVKATCPF